MPNVLAICREIQGVPTEIQIIPFGRHETDNGTFILDELGMAGILADFESRKNEMVIDYEHQSLGEGEAPAAGWIKKLVSKGYEGLWAVVDWTPKAIEYLKNREYRYLSPVFLKTKADDRVVRLLNAGLTNTPAIDGMVPLVNKFKGGDVDIDPDSKDASLNSNKEVQIMKQLLALLGLPADATEDQAVQSMKQVQSTAALGSKALVVLELKEDATEKDLEAAVVALKEVVSPIPGEILEALDLKEDASASEAVGTIQAMRAGHVQSGSLLEEVNALKKRLAKRDAEEAVALAMKEGKVTPANRDWALDYAEKDLAAFKAFAAKAPRVVDTKEIGDGEVTGGEGIDAVQMSVNKALGVNDETFRKHNKKEQGDA